MRVFPNYEIDEDEPLVHPFAIANSDYCQQRECEIQISANDTFTLVRKERDNFYFVKNHITKKSGLAPIRVLDVIFPLPDPVHSPVLEKNMDAKKKHPVKRMSETKFLELLQDDTNLYQNHNRRLRLLYQKQHPTIPKFENPLPSSPAIDTDLEISENYQKITHKPIISRSMEGPLEIATVSSHSDNESEFDFLRRQREFTRLSSSNSSFGSITNNSPKKLNIPKISINEHENDVDIGIYGSTISSNSSSTESKSHKQVWVRVENLNPDFESSEMKNGDILRWIDFDPNIIESESRLQPGHHLECETWTGNYVIVPSEFVSLPSTTRLAVLMRKRPRAEVIMEYLAENRSEISAKEGEIIYLHAKKNDGWYAACNKSGARGLIPADNLKIMMDIAEQ